MRIEAPTEALVTCVAEDLRECDRLEMGYLRKETPEEVLLEHLDNVTGGACVVCSDDGVPLAFGGVKPTTVISNSGIVWMYGTNAIYRHKVGFLKISRALVQNHLRAYNLLYNYVWSGNTATIAWLKLLGCTLAPARPYGFKNENFNYFEICANRPYS